ncbi:protein-cysteine N-palmitoyltransferase HHAT isoform X2 [Heterodontus francisci]|uniref:protein-cysteine N-palmitoyltransferase HHAT isoform X2 n=1 Tax=Heterodontus francisci TaxID=7792 RepID=UPI00355B5CC6
MTSSFLSLAISTHPPCSHAPICVLGLLQCSSEHRHKLEEQPLIYRLGTLQPTRLNIEDPTDFEWSFWTEWVMKLLLWTLLGHVIISQVTGAFLPKFRMWLLMIYGMWACFLTVGYKGLVVILLHLFISYTVAQLQVPVLSWLCSVLLLYSLQMDSLGKIQKRWYETENEYFLLLFCLALCNLRYTSFSLEHCWHRDSPQRHCVSFCWLLAYVFYYPVFHNGPIICYDDFKNQMQKAKTFVPKTDYLCLLLGGMRILFWWWLTESMLHLMYIHAIQHQETILESASYWTLGGLGFAHALFFYMKYLLLYGVPSIIMCLDGIKPPRLPRCTSSLYSFTGTWREFDVGLHRWLVRYIYIPLGGSRHGVLRIMFSSAMAFSFVCYWHGGHNFMLNWAALNWAGVMIENILKMVCSNSPAQEIIEKSLSARMQRRAHAALAGVATTLLILSNLVFLCGNQVGKIYWNRTFVQEKDTENLPETRGNQGNFRLVSLMSIVGKMLKSILKDVITRHLENNDMNL